MRTRNGIDFLSISMIGILSYKKMNIINLFMKKLSPTNNVYTIIITVTILQGCISQKYVKQYPELKMPDSYYGTMDSYSLGDFNRGQFFRDTILLSLIDTAIKNNLVLKNATEKILISRANLLMQKGLRLPSLNGHVSGSVDQYGKYTMTGVGNFDTNLSQNISEDQKIGEPVPEYFLGLKSSWEIDLWGKLRAKKESARHSLLASESGKQWLTTQLVAQVASLYYELLALDNRLEIIRRNIDLQEKAVEIVEAQMQGGRATALAVQQFNAQLKHTQVLEQQTRLNIIEMENEMNVLLGRFAQTPVPRGLPLRLQIMSGSITSGVPADLLTRRPDIRQAEMELSASKANVIAARKAFFPSIILTPHLGFNSFKLPLLFNGSSIASGLLGSLTQPIFNQYQLKTNYAVANAEQNIAFNNFRQKVLEAYQEVLSYLKGIEHYKKIVALNQAEAQYLTDAVDISNDLYLSGYASYLEVITAQKGVLESELNRTASQNKLLQATLDLYRSLGGGWK